MEPTGKHVPFCSQRCRQIDLARWLGERYGLPIYRDSEDDEEDSPPEGQSPGGGCQPR